ncbi:MAG: prepilin-type N-terminal cleavage/methylation domain-containing protein [Myxococcales bacterium]|nr:prepilin-type N-terminal cleavage/methylation domain-containing protein [Myxococcales bacterium]MDD9970326.1 prepilin-type N-terminal cleavage/methylation domain-containing protein [Myxococcales bacterium]
MGMTLIELVIVVAILALGATGLGFSLGALARTNLKSGATKVAAAVRYAYNRAVARGTTVRIVFDLPGNHFAVQEAHGRITLARNEEFRRVHGVDKGDLDTGGAVDPWAAARARLEQPLEPSLGESPFGAIEGARGEPVKRFTKVELGRHVNIVRLLVPHEPAPKETGQGAVHFFPTGYTEHAVIHLSDGDEGIYSVEIHPLTGRTKIHRDAFEPDEFLDDPENLEATEVDE